MKIRLTLKDPDGVWDSVESAGIDPNEKPHELLEVFDRFVEYGEYVTIELDTDTGTARVVPVREG